MKSLTQERLKELLCYDPDTGIFTWKVRTSNRIKVGDKTGCINGWGYLRVAVDGRLYQAHRLAWFYITGRWPSDEIDHKNNIKTDNQWANLRDVSGALNRQNLCRAKANNKSKFLGVSVKGKSFEAKIRIGGKAKYLGLFNTPELAHEAYVQAKRVLHPGNLL